MMKYVYLFKNDFCISKVGTNDIDIDLKHILVNTYDHYVISDIDIDIKHSKFVNGELINTYVEPTDLEAEIKKNLAESLGYLNSTDWYYARYIETGIDVPLDISTKRFECREYIKNNT